MIYLIADTHFYHKNIIKYCNRPFSSVEEMNQVMINNWNAIVTNDDIVIHLGDFCFPKYIEGLTYKERYLLTVDELLVKLNGRKYILRGNHDPSYELLDECYWSGILTSPYYFKKFVLTHKPIETDRINIHGHVHEKYPLYYDNKFNVSVDAINFRPISLKEIEEIVYE